MLYSNGIEVASLKFNAAGKDNLNWFSQNSLVQSPWSDLKTASSLQAFSIDGAIRTFEISALYAGCGNDVGWFLLTKPFCPWETRFTSPSILYSKLSNAVNWNQYGMKHFRILSIGRRGLIFQLTLQSSASNRSHASKCLTSFLTRF